MSERSEVILSDGVRLHVEIAGPADAPVTVVLLHGWCLDRRTWHHQVAALRDGPGDHVRRARARPLRLHPPAVRHARPAR